jgi:hypothetical protein
VTSGKIEVFSNQGDEKCEKPCTRSERYLSISSRL